MSDMHYTDPATAPTVPLLTTLTFERDVHDRWPDFNYISEGPLRCLVVVRVWDRETDQVNEYRLSTTAVEGTRTDMPLNETDEQWLRNMGARP